MIKPLLITAFTFALALAAPARAADAQDAEEFVQTNAQEIITILQELENGERTIEEVKAEFRARIDELAAVERITNFVTGRYRRLASEEEMERFRRVFREFAINVYETELTNYAGQTLTVTDTITRNPGDWIVKSEVTGGPQGKTYQVNWRVMEMEDGLQVLDAQVSGVWLAQTQRDQITSIIGDAGGRLGAATEVLCERIREQDREDWQRVCAPQEATAQTGEE